MTTAGEHLDLIDAAISEAESRPGLILQAAQIAINQAGSAADSPPSIRARLEKCEQTDEINPLDLLNKVERELLPDALMCTGIGSLNTQEVAATTARRVATVISNTNGDRSRSAWVRSGDCNG